MTWKILDSFGGNTMAVTNEEGEDMEFDTKEEAEKYAREELQPDYWKVIEE